MNLFGSKIVVIGPSCTEACKKLDGLGAHVYHLESRNDAMKGLFGLLANKILPDAVIVNWQVNEEDSDQNRFYKLAKRESFNTAESMIGKMIKLLDGAPIIIHNVSNGEIPECVRCLPGVDIIDGLDDPVAILQQEPSNAEGRRA